MKSGALFCSPLRIMVRIRVRLAGAAGATAVPECRLVTFEPDGPGGWDAFEAAVLRAFGEDARLACIAALRLCYDDPPDLLARDSISQLREMDRVEVELRSRGGEPGRDEAAPVVATTPPAAAPQEAPVLYSTTRPADAAIPYEALLSSGAQFGAPDKRAGNRIVTAMVRALCGF